jgi:hypothetical protein
LIPVSWSWTHFKLLPLSSLISRHAPHISLCILFFSERTSSEDRCDTTVHKPLPLPTSWRGLSHAFTLPQFHTQLSCPIRIVSTCVCLFVCICVGGGKRVGSSSGTILSQSPTQHPHALIGTSCRSKCLSFLRNVWCAWPPSHVGVGVCKRGVCGWDYTCVWVCVGCVSGGPLPHCFMERRVAQCGMVCVCVGGG